MTAMRNRVFHQAAIAGLTFDGIISADGSCISCRTGSGVALGVSGLRQFEPDVPSFRRQPPCGWWVVKYTDEARIGLPGFGQAAIQRLSDEFGLVILTERDLAPAGCIRQQYFFTSPAWDALGQWVAQHPCIAGTHVSCDPYLPGWHGRALAEIRAMRESHAGLVPHFRGPQREDGSWR